MLALVLDDVCVCVCVKSVHVSVSGREHVAWDLDDMSYL